MKKNVYGRKLGRDMNERTALFKALMSSLVLQESIKTTEAKAKAIKPEIEKLVTKAKHLEKGADAVLQKSLSKEAFEKMTKEIGPRFAQRQGGYTRIVRLGERFGDNSPLVLIEWVDKMEIVPVEGIKRNDRKSAARTTQKQTKETKKPAKRVVKKAKK